IAAVARGFLRRCTAKPAAWREHGQRFDEIGFSSAVGAEQADWACVEFKIERRVIAEFAEAKARDVKGVCHALPPVIPDTRRVIWNPGDRRADCLPLDSRSRPGRVWND